jgi:putative transcriptional regulator
MGLVINKPADLCLEDLFDKVDLPLRREDLRTQPVLQGGPLHNERGFVLHDPVSVPEGEEGSVYASTLKVPQGLELTTSRDVLEALSSGAGPRRVLVTLGYSSWGEGQLESELAENAWLTVPALADIVFETPLEQRYDKALELLGLKSWLLSPQAGHA